jgi:hypothetical protein
MARPVQVRALVVKESVARRKPLNQDGAIASEVF